MTEDSSQGLTEAALKKADQNGYSRGYQAGKRRRNTEETAERRQREKQAYFDKAMLAALPACIAAQGWTQGDKPITDVAQRVRLAVLFANEALNQRRVF